MVAPSMMRATKIGAAFSSTGAKASGIMAEFKGFILQENVLSLAVAVIFAAVIRLRFAEDVLIKLGQSASPLELIIVSLVEDILSPFISLIGPGNVLPELFFVLKQGETANVTYKTREIATDDGAVTLNYGNFLEKNLHFIFIALCLFLIIKLFLCLTREGPCIEYECPKCLEIVKEKAVRCPHCTSEPIVPLLIEKEAIPTIEPDL